MFRTRARTRAKQTSSVVVLGSLALSASTITRTSAVSAYPPTVDFTRPIDWADGDLAVMQWSLDPTFGTGVSETASPVTLLTGTVNYNFGLSAIVSGVYYIRMGAWRGTRPTSLNWSHIVGVGDAVAPTITSAATMADYQFAAGTLALTANKTSTWAIVGGTDMAQFSISGSTLSSLAQATTKTMTVQVQATSLFGVASTIQTITDTVGVNTPSAFSFTAVSSGTRSTLYTSNTITVAGLVGGVSVPVSVTGAQYSKNGGAYTSSAGTAVNGDTFALQETSSASYSTGVSGTLTIGATSGSYSVTTLADPAAVPAFTATASPAVVNKAYSSATHTFTAQNIGTAKSTRTVLVGVFLLDASTFVSTLTVGGISGTLVTRSTAMELWRVPVPTGTSADVVVTAGSTINYIGIVVGALVDVTATPTGSAILANGFNNSPQSVSATTPTGGFSVVVGYEQASGTASWTNATGDFNTFTSPITMLMAHTATAGTATISVSGFGNVNSSLVVGSWGP